jgi:GTP-binding protein EngB required for normal cell division
VVSRGGGPLTISLAERITALQRGTELAAGRLPDSLVFDAERVLARAGERSELSATHTVVAFAGATGSGKSSLFNAVAGLDLSPVGVRRPTTAAALACVWGPQGAGPLLDWLGIPTRHQVNRESALDAGLQGDLTGLVLLDLPDHDSTELSHRVEVDRIVALADLLVWVLDPQKYADDLVHARYLRRLTTHQEVVVVVLNQIDRLDPQERNRCLAHLRQLLDEDGLTSVPTVATSAVTGEGVGELRSLLRATVKKRRAAEARTAADLAAVATTLQATVDGGGPGVSRKDRDRLVDALAAASGVPAVVDAVRHAYVHRSRQATGWPLVRWLGKLRSDPLKRLRIDRRDVAPELQRSSLPAPTPAQRSAAAKAVRALGDNAVAGAPRAVAQAVQGVTRRAADDLPDRLDQAVTATNLGSDRVPVWWRVIGALQWLGVLVLFAGLAWWAVLVVLGLLALPRPEPTLVGEVPAHLLLVVGGLVVGVILGWLARGFAAIGARRAARRADRRLRAAVESVADKAVVQPVREELKVLDELRTMLTRAAR